MSQMRRQKYLGQDENILCLCHYLTKSWGKKTTSQIMQNSLKRKEKSWTSFHFPLLDSTPEQSPLLQRLLFVRQAPPAGKNLNHRHFSATIFFIDPRWFSDIFHVVILQSCENEAITESQIWRERVCLSTETRNWDTCLSLLRESSLKSCRYLRRGVFIVKL